MSGSTQSSIVSLSAAERRHRVRSAQPVPGPAPAAKAPAGRINIEPPQCLVDEMAISEWHRVVPLLMAGGILDKTHRSLLLGYCNSVAKAIRAEEILAREGRYYQTQSPQGSMIRRRHPAIRDAEDGWNAVRRFARDLGLVTTGASGTQNNATRRAIFK